MATKSIFDNFSRENKGPVRAWLNQRFTAAQISSIKRTFAGFFPISDLSLLAYLYGTDKVGYHNYAPHYAHHFHKWRNLRFNMLEIGIGGNDHPEYGGESLRMWANYFPKARIFGLDIHDKSRLDGGRIKTFKGSQADPEFLRWVVKQIGEVSIIVDDGSHQNEHVICSFEVLFPLLAENGMYAIEDLETSYWNNYGGSSTDLLSAPTSMNMLKRLCDGLNYQDFTLKDYSPSYTDQTITGVSFYHGLCFIQKGTNDQRAGTFTRPEPVEEIST